MIVREVMTRPALTIWANTPIKTALALMDHNDITALPVVDEQQEICGVVSEADLIKDAVPPDLRFHVSYGEPEITVLPPSEVGDVMNRHPITVHPESDLADAVDLLVSTGVKSLPVVDDHNVVLGVVSRRDVVRVLARADGLIEAQADDLFRRLGLDWTVEVDNGVAGVSGPDQARGSGVASVIVAAVPGVVGAFVKDEEREHRRHR